MPRYMLAALLLWGFVCLVSCHRNDSDEGPQDELSQRLEEFTAIRENTYLSRGERQRKQDSLRKVFTRLYPGALPIGKDSTSKIFLAKIPDTVGIFQRISDESGYEKPPFSRDSFVTYPQKAYFDRVLNYGLRRGNQWTPRQGMLAIVKDEGYMVEWLAMARLKLMLTGKDRGGFDANMRSHEFMQLVEYGGQKWAVWYDRPRGPAHGGSRVFITLWNHRFSIVAITTDTSVQRPDFLGKLIDFAWLDQLKYPAR